jgi:predicted dehydrogenase
VPATTPPANLNWDFWLGPTPYTEYIPDHVHHEFRWYYDYSGGVMTDWGAHHNDIVQWGLGMDESGPVFVDGTNAQFSETGPHDVAQRFTVHYKYANGVDLYCHTDGNDVIKENGIKFTGEHGWVFVSRTKIEASDPDILKQELGPDDTRLYKSDDHHKNWLECIQTRKRCICDVEVGHHSVVVCHIGNISMRLGRPLKWDPQQEQFIDDPLANRMLRRPMRAPWHL